MASRRGSERGRVGIAWPASLPQQVTSVDTRIRSMRCRQYHNTTVPQTPACTAEAYSVQAVHPQYRNTAVCAADSTIRTNICDELVFRMQTCRKCVNAMRNTLEFAKQLFII